MDAQTYDDLRQRVLGAIQDYASSVPEDGETWESWFHAAFDMASQKVSAVFETHHVSCYGDAAAPDLLEALRNLCEVSGRSRDISAAREKAQEAIAKAEGIS